ncbi:Glycosyltransferase involved in cell wall bisynthesis [Prevotella aff. ruminicola Tc2-24]|uniref:Glycosyltransferase involved in cell wall bisynthesis n=1 Tax=Prevotella aff. ruminicola Tc2-24 TaxID=81582 RepID=A0A1I0MHN9_9BACT|nr:glycosyltransferase family 4 protein [Prevotella aff. ruminicola Tc2-24]MBR5989279.1 glycosyltransferase family 4 protein [Prevotella sp.]SEV87873.1 Glycosyltransferase involved in cell wall bisynthesis [Prevotella aff. ruminicola Tc2-24]
MRLLIIHRSFALVGGAERVIIDKANYMSNHGHQVMLVSYEQGTHLVPFQLNPSVLLKDLDCRFFTLSRFPIPLRLYHFFHLKHQLRNALRETFKDFQPDVVVLASDWQFLINVVLDAAQSIPVIAEFHNAYDFITKKIGNTGNGIIVKLTRFYYRHFLNQFRKCAHLVVLTENDAQHWRKHSDHVTVIPNPVTHYPDVVDDVPKEEGRIICVGRLNGQKRIDRLISAFSMIADKYPKWHVDIYGEGDLKAALERQIQESHLQGRVVIHEPVKTIYEEYKKSQMLVLSSEYEGRPLVLIEAMACGVPCVSFDCPSGPREIIEDGVTGLLAEKGHVADLAKKIEWMITHDQERKAMGEKAYAAATVYKPSVIMKKWEVFYESVVK